MFNSNFKQGVLALSDALQASEHFCANLLEKVIQDATQPVDQSTVQTAILSYHTERLALLQCLRIIFEVATRSDAPPSRIREFVQKYMYDLLQGPYILGTSTTSGNLAAKLVSEIDLTRTQISHHKTVVQCKHDVQLSLNIPSSS